MYVKMNERECISIFSSAGYSLTELIIQTVQMASVCLSVNQGDGEIIETCNLARTC